MTENDLLELISDRKNNPVDLIRRFRSGVKIPFEFSFHKISLMAQYAFGHAVKLSFLRDMGYGLSLSSEYCVLTADYCPTAKIIYSTSCATNEWITFSIGYALVWLLLFNGTIDCADLRSIFSSKEISYKNNLILGILGEVLMPQSLVSESCLRLDEKPYSHKADIEDISKLFGVPYEFALYRMNWLGYGIKNK